MKQVERRRWILDSETPPGRRIKTRWHMTEEQAASYRRRNPVKIDGTREVIDLPETPEEQTLRNAHFRPG